MSERAEPCYSCELFVPREILFDLCTGAEHLALWFTDEAPTILEAVAPSRVVYRLGTVNARDAILTLEAMGSTTHISVREPGLPEGAAQDQATLAWQQRFAALENYLSSI